MMKYLPVLSRVRHVNKGLWAGVFALCLLFMLPITGLANTVNISDAANVLNVSQVRSEASNLPNPINIYTTSTFSGSTSAFDQQTKSHITNPNLLVMAIDTTHKHVTIVGGSSVHLLDSQYTDATNAFVSAYRSNNGDYTASTIAAISSLRSALGAAPIGNGNGTVPGGNGNTTGQSSSGAFPALLGTLLCVGLIALIIVGVLFMVGRRRRMGYGQGGVPMGNTMPYQQPYNQPYNQGYPPNYGGPYNQGQGMNPLVAGGLGAAAGGLIGYEIGKDQGEDAMREQNQDQGGNWSGGGNDFGGGSSADFGNGGGDFGGGAGADFGGGGGGGGDFGGGSSGNF